MATEHAQQPRPEDRFAGSRVLVTGGAGFLGSWLCERLLDEGADVDCVDSLLTGHASNIAHLSHRDGFVFTQADTSEAVPVQDTGRPLRHVFHLASPASPRHYQRHPVETLLAGSIGTHHALEVAGRHGARFVLASSSEVYGDPDEHPQQESYRGRVSPTGPRSCYDEAKRFGEAMAQAHRRQHGTDTAIARIFNTYGPRMSRDDGRVVPTLLRQAVTGKPMTVFGDGSQTRSLCWVGDTVEGLLRLALSAEHDPVNVGSEDEWTIADLARLMRDLTGGASEIELADLPEDDPVVRRPDLTRARELLGWEPRVTLEDGLRRTLSWLAEVDGLPVPLSRAAG